MIAKNYLAFGDVPVLLIGFNRPEFIKARVRELARMPIKKLYISLDGGSYENYDEMVEALEWCQNTLENLEFLQIYKNEKNLGLVTHITSTISKLLKLHSHLIIVEDDVVLGNNFFVNMVKGFNYQIENNKKGIVGGFSATNLSCLKFIENKWRESKYTSIWGWGCSSEIWNDYNSELDEKNFQHDLGNSKTWANLSNFQKQVWTGRFRKTILNPSITWDIQLQYLSFTRDFINLYPISSFTRNIGYSDQRSTNTKNLKPNWMSVRAPDHRLISKKDIFFSTRKFYELLDSNVLMSDTKTINWWKHKKNYQIPFLKKK